ncbi:MAG: HAMP domain-containing sensor histidine kinase [Peptostreptococcales bacterium]
MVTSNRFEKEDDDVQDLCERSKEEARAYIAELEKKDKNKDEFISILSHELRNPIAAIKGGIELLELVNKNRETLKIIMILKRQVEQLSKLVDGLLDMTQITQNKIILNKAIVNLNKIVNDAIVDIRPQYEEKGIKLLKSICKHSIFVNVDAMRIAHCIGNILRNALKYTHQDGTVSISLDIEGEKAVIKIQDNGIGISSEMLLRIFEPYEQAIDNSSNSLNKGLGLGLFIVKNIIEMHDGDVSASSPGLTKGSLFTMRLPIL